jgi:hypothetical protein
MDTDDETSSSEGESVMSVGDFEGPGVADVVQQDVQWDDGGSAEDDSESSSEVSSNASSNDNDDELRAGGALMPADLEGEVAGPIGGVLPFQDESDEEDQRSTSDEDSVADELSSESGSEPSDSSSSDTEVRALCVLPLSVNRP